MFIYHTKTLSFNIVYFFAVIVVVGILIFYISVFNCDIQYHSQLVPIYSNICTICIREQKRAKKREREKYIKFHFLFKEVLFLCSALPLHSTGLFSLFLVSLKVCCMLYSKVVQVSVFCICMCVIISFFGANKMLFL